MEHEGTIISDPYKKSHGNNTVLKDTVNIMLRPTIYSDVI